MSSRILVISLSLLAVGAVPAEAQTPPLPDAFLNVGVGTVISDRDFDYSVTFPLFAETGRIFTTVALDRPFAIDFGGGMHLWKRLGVGASFVVTTADGTLASEITLPSPFLFDESITGLAHGSTRQTTREVLIEGLFSLHHSGRWLIVLSGGPSITYLKQDLAGDRFRIDYVFPFEQIDVTTTSGDTTTGRAWGGHVGLSATWKASARIGFDGRIRWSGASVEVEDFDGTRLAIKTGGLALAGGLRVLF